MLVESVAELVAESVAELIVELVVSLEDELVPSISAIQEIKLSSASPLLSASVCP